MHRLIIPLIAVAATAAQAQSSPPACKTHDPEDSCTGSTCKIDVTFEDGSIFVTPRVLKTTKGSGTKQIHWHAGTGVKFDDQHGITFKSASSQFSESGPIDSGNKF